MGSQSVVPGWHGGTDPGRLCGTHRSPMFTGLGTAGRQFRPQTGEGSFPSRGEPITSPSPTLEERVGERRPFTSFRKHTVHGEIGRMGRLWTACWDVANLQCLL